MSLKSFGKNTIIYAIGAIFVRAGAFFLIPLYTHCLSINDYGLLATLLITVQIMMTLMGLGMRTTLVRFAKDYEVKKKMNILLGTSSLINLLGGLIGSSLLFAFFVPFFRSVLHGNDVYQYMGLVCCIALLQSLNMHIVSHYRARGEALKYMMVGVSTPILLFITSFLLISVFELGVTGALLASVITHGAILSILSIHVFSNTGLGVSIYLVPELLRFGCPLVFSMSSEVVIEAAGIYLLSYFAGLDVVAVYSLGYKFAQLLSITVVGPFSLAFQPYVFADIDTPGAKETMSRLLTYLVLAVMSMAFLIVLGSRLLLPLFAPPQYSSAFLVVLLLLPSTAFLPAAPPRGVRRGGRGLYYFGETLLSASKKTHIIGFTMSVCALVSIILNYILIQAFGWYGAAISLNVSFILAGSAVSVIGIRKLGVTLEWRRLRILGALILFVFFAFVAVRSVNMFLFGAVALVSAAAIISTLVKSGFFHSDEIIAIKRLILKARWA
jgi:O-antigen/teichoic acid export membrane protein